VRLFEGLRQINQLRSCNKQWPAGQTGQIIYQRVENQRNRDRTCKIESQFENKSRQQEQDKTGAKVGQPVKGGEE